jgi:hypothetical protein
MREHLAVYCDASAEFAVSRREAGSSLCGIAMVAMSGQDLVDVQSKILPRARGIKVIASLEFEALTSAITYALDHRNEFRTVHVMNDNEQAVGLMSRLLGGKSILKRDRSWFTPIIAVLRSRYLHMKANNQKIEIAHVKRQSCVGIRLADKFSRWVYTGISLDYMMLAAKAVYGKKKATQTNIFNDAWVAMNDHLNAMNLRECRRISHHENFCGIFNQGYFEHMRAEQEMSRLFG